MQKFSSVAWETPASLLNMGLIEGRLNPWVPYGLGLSKGFRLSLIRPDDADRWSSLGRCTSSSSQKHLGENKKIVWYFGLHRKNIFENKKSFKNMSENNKSKIVWYFSLHCEISIPLHKNNIYTGIYRNIKNRGFELYKIVLRIFGSQ